MNNEIERSKKKEKMNTPEYVLDIRKGKYTPEGAVTKIFKECGIKQLPINVWDIARKLNFEVFEAGFNDNNTLGMMVDTFEVPVMLEKFDCKRAIILNKNDKKNVQSFTIAHELACFLYDCTEQDNCYDTYSIDHGQEEQQIRVKEDPWARFAELLLMPEILIREYISSSSNRWNKKSLIQELSKVCMVSEETAEKRLKQLEINFW